jgi:drug/metabolite transporter (DMT)-like permease
MWPLNRWAVRRGARRDAIGVCIGVVALAIMVLAALLSGKPLLVKPALLFGAIGGAAYAVGFVLIIFYCLKIGPVGPTVTVNNLGLLWPVIIGMIWFSKDAPSWLVVAGVILTVAALILIGWSCSKDGALSRKWVVWVFIGWCFSGVSMSCQLLSSKTAPDGMFAYVAAGFGLSAILLAVPLLKRGGALRRAEVIAGAGTGIIVGFVLPATLWLLTRMPASVIFPVTVASPAVLMLLTSHFVFKEKLSALGWTGCFLGVAGIVLLNL